MIQPLIKNYELLKINFVYARNMDVRPTNTVTTLANIDDTLSQIECSWGESQPQLVTLTTSPTKVCANYHDRMPLLIAQTDIEAWLDSIDYARHLLQEKLNDDSFPLRTLMV